MLNKINSFSLFIKESDKKKYDLSKLDKYTLFFIFENKVYGSTEENRLIFAKLKNKDEDLPINWKKDLGFQAEEINLSQESGSRLFYFKDINLIKIIDVEKALEKLNARI